MQNKVDARGSFVHRVEIKNIGFTEVDSRQNLLQVFPFSSGKIVHAPNLLVLCQQRPRERRSNKAANARDEIKSHILPS